MAKSEYHMGFYIFDTLTNEIKLSKTLESDKYTLAPQNFLSYSGKFSRSDSIINYSCDKISEIYFFNNYGEFEKKITTKDSTPKPKIVNSNSAYYYKRGDTYNTNNGVLIFGDSLLVFSSRTVKKDVIMIDLYSYKTGNYLCSNELSYNNKTSIDINLVSKNKNKLIIGFDEGISTFNPT